MDPKYIFNNIEDRSEYERLQLIEQVFDPYTQSYVERIGLRPGASCLEIGPGAGSFMRWLCERVGPDGRVTALDLNTRFVSSENLPNLTVMQGDVSKEELGADQFDFVHARYVFIHVLGYRESLDKIYRALKPGGWILLEEPDFHHASAETDDEELNRSFKKIHEAIKKLFGVMNLDPAFGGKLPSLLEEYGFTGIGHETVAEFSPGRSLTAELMKRSTLHLQDKYLQTGMITKEDIENYCRLADDPEHSAVYYGSISCWGQKPF